MLEKVKRVLKDRRSGVTLMAVGQGCVVAWVVIAPGAPAWVIALAGVGFGAQVMVTIERWMLVTVRKLLDDARRLDAAAQEKYTAACAMIEDLQDADGVAILKGGRVEIVRGWRKTPHRLH